MDLVDALDVAVEGFRRRLAQVEEGQWSGPTPCEEWDVRFLVAHVVGGNRFASLVLDGAPADRAVGEIMAHRQLGDEPLVDFTSSAGEQRRRFRAEGALEQTVSHPSGVLTGRRFLEMRVCDTTLHTWDLARAIGADDTLDPHLAAAVLAIVEGSPDGVGFGTTPLGRASADAPTQERLLDGSGRSSAWRSGHAATDHRGQLTQSSSDGGHMHS